MYKQVDTSSRSFYGILQISWQLLRIEASAKSERTEKRASINAPLRLITSGGKIRIALKKHSGGSFDFNLFAYGNIQMAR